MFRKTEKEDAWKAGAYAIAVHVALLGALLVSFNWKAAHPVLNVTEVELWDSLPSGAPPPPPVEAPKPEPKVEPPVVKEEPKPEPAIEPKAEESKIEEPKVDIELENKKKLAQEQEKVRLEAEKLKKEEALEKKKQLAALQKEALNDAAPDESRPLKKAKDNVLKKLQEEALADEQAVGHAQAKAAKAAASKGVIDEYRRKIQDKIKGNVNNSLCGDGDPSLKFQISLIPTGELSGNPKLSKSSEIDACDEAVERAIIASQPLPMPDDVDLKSEFKNLNLTFNPNR